MERGLNKPLPPWDILSLSLPAESPILPPQSLPAGKPARGVQVRRFLHRLREARRSRRISRSDLARKLNISLAQLMQQERPSSDITLSTFYQWQRAMDATAAELLVEQDDGLSQPVLKRSRMVRLMKTARSLQELAGSSPVRRMAENMISQLVELMPELQGVAAWPLGKG